MEELRTKIPPEAYNALINNNIKSLNSILTLSKANMVKLTKLAPETIQQIVAEASALLLNGKFYSVDQLPEWSRISTGCPSIDEITRGGIPINGITEIFGCSGYGKTQLCLQLALMVQLPQTYGGLEKGAIYICTEDVFPSKRFNELSGVFKEKYINREFEDNVLLEHIADFEQLRRCLFDRLPKLLLVRRIGLIVIDSIAGVFRSETLGVNYCDRSRQLVAIAVQLHKISTQHDLAVVCVNQVTDNIATEEAQPCLGLTWSNLVTCRFSINRKNHSPVRNFEVVFAPDLLRTSCEFQIIREGLSPL